MINKALNIHTSPVKLNMNINNSKLQIDSGDLIKLDMRADLPLLEMKTTQAKVEIDQSQCFSECGLKSHGQLMEEIAVYAENAGIQAIGKMVQQGNELANIHHGGDPIIDQAEDNRFGQYVYDTNIKFMPTSRPTINVIEGRVDTNLVEGKVHNNTPYKMPTINFSPASIDYHISDYGRVDISVVDVKV